MILVVFTVKAKGEAARPLHNTEKLLFLDSLASRLLMFLSPQLVILYLPWMEQLIRDINVKTDSLTNLVMVKLLQCG